MDVRRESLAATVASLVMFCTAEAAACPICIPYPKTTLADLFIESESVVMVREDGERPYVFLPVEILKGSSQVQFGPYTTGGAINMITTEVPDLMPPIRYKHYLVDLNETRVIWIQARVRRSLFWVFESSFDNCVRTLRLGDDANAASDEP